MESRKITIEGSGRHVHLSSQDLETLYGKGYELTPKKWLSQPGQFASEERVKIEGPKGSFAAVSILGPVRPDTQVEISFTDARTLGVTAPVRESGDVKGSAPIHIVGPKGEIDISEGVIIAKRHIHFTPEDAEKLGIKDKQNVKVKVGGERGLIFDEVVARVSPKYATFMHIDFDEANAIAGAKEGEIID
ncbi:MAG TPA: phosphate propanoyltransferase [Ruminiclostridium sp.]|nr:phosphate propanoyltransferase [Ruminiclostridium sp.]